MVFDVYTDGSCWNNCPHTIGAWAFAIVDPDDKEFLLTFESKAEYKATSNLMEMAAVQNALELLSQVLEEDNDYKHQIRIHSDSAYVVNCFLERWYDKWEACNYIAVLNAEQWQKLLIKVRELRRLGARVEFVKVKGHVGVKYNEIVDKLAGEERRNEITRIQKGTKFLTSAREEATRLLQNELDSSL